MSTNDIHTVLFSEMINDREGLYEGIQDASNAGFPDGYQPIIGIPVPVQQGHQGPLLLADAVGASLSPTEILF
jgi:hypothetical protein